MGQITLGHFLKTHKDNERVESYVYKRNHNFCVSLKDYGPTHVKEGRKLLIITFTANAASFLKKVVQ